MITSLLDVITITKRIKLKLLGIDFSIRVERDNIYPDSDRIFIQIVYNTECNKTGKMTEFHGDKYYLSPHCTKDEIVKKCFKAFKDCVLHEVMEGFTVDGIVLFNPHVDFEELLKVSNKEVSRNN